MRAARQTRDESSGQEADACRASAKPSVFSHAFLVAQARQAEVNNGVIHSAFVALFKDLIRLFACYNDGVINLLSARCPLLPPPLPSTSASASQPLASAHAAVMLMPVNCWFDSIRCALQASSST